MTTPTPETVREIVLDLVYNADGKDLTAAENAAAAICALAPPAPDDDYYPSHEVLCDIVSLQNEHWALNGGGPHWKQRWKAALSRAEELVRVEP